GLPDLVSLQNNSISIRLNATVPNGVVQFSSTQTIAWTPPTQQGPFGIQIPTLPPARVMNTADFAGDGRADLLLQFATPPQQFTGESAQMIGLISISSGTFTAGPVFGQVSVGWVAADLVLLDWNGDGCTDVAESQGSSPAGWMVFLSTCSSAGTFS